MLFLKKNYLSINSWEIDYRMCLSPLGLLFLILALPLVAWSK